MPTAPGVSDGLASSTRGIRNEPHELMNVKIAETRIPGVISGMTIRNRMLISLAPSIAAASSNSPGTWPMKFFSSQIENGTDMEASTRAVTNLDLDHPGGKTLCRGEL